MDTPTGELDRLQGVWFPTFVTENGRFSWQAEPSFPAPRSPWLMTVHGPAFHVTSNADYYATGGWLRIRPPDRLAFVYPEIPAAFDGQNLYRLDGDELLLCSGGFPWSGPHDAVCTTRYVRVAARPTPEMLALFEPVVRGWALYPDRRPG